MQGIKKKCSQMSAFIMAIIIMCNMVNPITVKATENTNVEPLFKYDMEVEDVKVDGVLQVADAIKEDAFSFKVSGNSSNKFLEITRDTTKNDTYLRYSVPGAELGLTTPLWFTMDVSIGDKAISTAKIRVVINGEETEIITIKGKAIESATATTDVVLSASDWCKFAIKVYCDTDGKIIVDSYSVDNNGELTTLEKGTKCEGEFSKIERFDLYLKKGSKDSHIGQVLKIDNVAAWQADNYIDFFAENVTPTYVAQIEGGESYETLEGAIEAASAAGGGTITLLDDVTATATVEIEENITLDLNGYTLDMGNNCLSSLGDVVDNSGKDTVNDVSDDKTGRLKIATETVIVEGVSIDKPKGKLAENNSQMPVYIADEGYMLANMTAQALKPVIDTDYFTSVSRPSFGAPHYEKLQGGASAAKLQFILRLDWTTDEKDCYQEFSYSDELVKNVYTNGKAFSVTVNGLADYASKNNVSKYVVSEYVKSDLGVVLKNNSFSMNTTSGK